MAETKDLSKKEGNFEDYKPLTLNLGVWWSMKKEGTRSSLSVNMTRDALIFAFRSVDEAGQKNEIIKKMKKTEVFMFVNIFKGVLADRLALAKSHYMAGNEGIVSYSVLPELEYKINNVYYSKDKGGFENTGNITIGTVEVDGKQRIAISAHNNVGKHIRVIFYEESAMDLVQITKHTVIDPEDLEFYRFCMEIENSLGKTVEYAGFDKIYQLLKTMMSNNEKKKGFMGGFFNKSSDKPKIEVNDNTDADADLFGGVDTTF